MTLATASGQGPAFRMDGQVTLAMVEAICALDDDVYRNHWITYAYHQLSERIRPHVAATLRTDDGRIETTENATWCTFARWSSFTVGEALDPNLPNRRLEQVINRWPESIKSRMRRFNKDLYLLSDMAMPRTLGIGNRFVFHDIGYAMTHFLDWYDDLQGEIDHSDTDAWEAAWTDYRSKIEVCPGSDLFQDADVSWLQRGLHSYLRAMLCTNDTARQRDLKGEFVLRGNVLLAVYEQWRLDPILKIALDPVARNFVEFCRPDPHHATEGHEPQVVLRRKGTRWALRHQSSLGRWLADQYGQIITRWWLAYEAPITTKQDPDDDGLVLQLVGRNLDGASQAFTDEQLRDAELLRILSIFDRERRLGSGSSWTRFADRMQFIVDLFRAEQCDPNLHGEQLLHPELLALDISADNLDRLRHVGDQPMDRFVSAYLDREDTKDARTIVGELIENGLDTDFGQKFRDPELDGTLPAWADDAAIKRGQEFLLAHGLEIATALLNASLPKSYTAFHGTKVLTATAELASGRVNRRVAETGQLLLDLMTRDEPDSLAPDTRASDSVRGVRLFHAVIRQMLLRDGWDSGRRPEPPHEPGEVDLAGAEEPDGTAPGVSDQPGEGADPPAEPGPALAANGAATAHRHAPPDLPPPCGTPINQEDLLGTLLAFTLVVFDALEEMGYEIPAKDPGLPDEPSPRDDYLHLWLVVGHLLGIDYTEFFRAGAVPSPDQQPLDEHKLRIIGQAIYRRSTGAGPDGQALSSALIQMMRGTLWGPARLLPPTATRWLIGDESADYIEVPPSETPARLALWVTRPLTRLVSGKALGKGSAWLTGKATRRMYIRWIEENRGGTRPEWRIENVRERWKLPPARGAGNGE